MLNTNGTLLTEERAELLLKYPPRKVNISLYGASAATYRDVCGYEEGFEKVLHAIQLLKERSIPVKLNCSLIPLNYHDLEKMHCIADKFDVAFQVTPYMFPPVRKNGMETDKFVRFDPEDAARMIIENARISFRDKKQDGYYFVGDNQNICDIEGPIRREQICAVVYKARRHGIEIQEKDFIWRLFRREWRWAIRWRRQIKRWKLPW